MRFLYALPARLKALVRRGAADRDLDEEIGFHIEQETAKNVRLGMDPAAARRKALVDFGGVTRTRETHREVRGVPWLEETFADARYALRALRRSPALAGAAVLTLALGVGANTAIFSAVNAVILRPLPFPAPDRLVMLFEENPEKGWRQSVVAPANFLDWKERVPAFQDAAAYTGGLSSVTLTGRGEPVILHSVNVTGSFFSVLGGRAALGRVLRPEETWKTGTPVAVLSDRAWRDHFGADPRIVGQTVTIAGTALQVVGVTAPGFAFPYENVDVWMPMAWDPGNRSQVWFRRAHWLRAVARLTPGVAPEQANAQFQQVVDRLKTEYPETNRVMGAGMMSLQTFLVGDTRLPLLVLMGAVVLLLLIACANVGNLLLVHAAGRGREMALRLAIGAGRGRLVRQALTESLVLSAAGGAAGLAVGWYGTRALAALQPEGMLRVSDVGLDWWVLGYVLAITTASGLLFGIAPAAWSAGRAPGEALKEGGRTGSEGVRARRWGDRLVVGEVALALLLTVGAGLLARSFVRLRQVDPGFDPRNVLAVSLALPDRTYDSGDKAGAFYEELTRRVRALPGVLDAATASELPLTQTGWTSDFTAAGRGPTEYGGEVAHRLVSPEYFRTMRVPVLRGRGFTAEDRRDTPRVVVINDALARSYFRGQDPIGQRIVFDRVPDSTSTWRTIVGVVGDEHQTRLGAAPQIEMFESASQNRSSALHLLVRTAGEPTALTPAVRRVVAEMDPNLALLSVRTMAAVHADSLARERFLMTLLLAFAVVGLLLATVGVYGVLAQLARRRTREMGIRIALGAQRGQVRWLVVRHGLALVGVGLAVGGAAALLGTRALATMLFQVPPTDPVTFGGVALLLALTGAAASWLPALRASRASPASVLREE